MDIVYAVVWVILIIFIKWPPRELVMAGLTVDSLHSEFFGQENENFVQHHLSRIMFTAIIHGNLISMYSLSMILNDSSIIPKLPIWFVTIAISVPLFTCVKVLRWCADKYRRHPLMEHIKEFTLDSDDEQRVIDSINEEYRSVDKLVIRLASSNRLVVTNTWIIKISDYDTEIADHSDARLVVFKADSQPFMMNDGRDVQYVSLQIDPNRPNLKAFNVRLSIGDFEEVRAKVQSPIIVLPDVNLSASITEKFVEVFKQHIQLNPQHTTDQEFEVCIGCMNSMADVKIQKRCQDLPDSEILCGNCNCRVMWCCGCMARWWASRMQEPRYTWLSSRCPCPMCRTPFCLLDVCPAISTATVADS